MIETSRPWLSTVPWQSVLTVNQALCQAQKVDYHVNSPAFERVRARWENASGQSTRLVDVLALFRECREALPFACNNGNTFAAIAKTLVDEWLQAMKPLEAQIVRTTVSHYVAGQVGKKELLQVLKHFSPVCQQSAPPQPQSAPAPVQNIQPQAAV